MMGPGAFIGSRLTHSPFLPRSIQQPLENLTSLTLEANPIEGKLGDSYRYGVPRWRVFLQTKALAHCTPQCHMIAFLTVPHSGLVLPRAKVFEALPNLKYLDGLDEYVLKRSNGGHP
jgi:hypothetical protein